MPAPPPTPERWRLISRLTAEALETPEPERDAWLATACGDDDELRREVASLLAAHAGAGSFLQDPALAQQGAAVAVAAAARASTGSIIGRRIGPYRIVSELGHGGMGVVYLAERADAAFEKKTAIKVVRGGFPGELMLQRFRDERRILATLDHPNIARLIDGGTTEDGLPYLVMEYVDGVSLDVYCDTARPSLVQRLQLFREVCAAVQFAHQRLVIHRDIKPRNILVDSRRHAQAARLRDREAARARRGHRVAYADRPAPVHARCGEPGTDPRRADDSSERRLRAGCAAVPVADRARPLWRDAADGSGNDPRDLRRGRRSPDGRGPRGHRFQPSASSSSGSC